MPDLLHRAEAILRECDPEQKALQTRILAEKWQNSTIRLGKQDAHHLPETPGRPEYLQTVMPGAVPRRRIGTPEGRIALLHAIAHIELNAIDLALDMLARFSLDPALTEKDRPSFVTDWLEVADDEARHFTMITKRLMQLGSHYGALGVHQGLWEAAHNTRNDLAARLAIAPMLLEARGLDVTPPMIEKLERAGDEKSAAVLKVIFEEEIGHVAKGVRWFNAVCETKGETPQRHFQTLVKRYLPAGLRPPFNHEARERAGLSRLYYQNFSPDWGIYKNFGIKWD